jgi:hypothetical protein
VHELKSADDSIDRISDRHKKGRGIQNTLSGSHGATVHVSYRFFGELRFASGKLLKTASSFSFTGSLLADHREAPLDSLSTRLADVDKH